MKTIWFCPELLLYLYIFLYFCLHLSICKAKLPRSKLEKVTCSASGCYMLLGWRTPLVILCMYLECGTDQEMSFLGGYPPPTCESHSSYCTPAQWLFCSQQPSQWAVLCQREGRLSLWQGYKKKKIIKQSQKKEFRSVTALGPCPFSMKVKKHLHIDWKAPYLQCTWDWQKCPDVPHKALLLVVSNLCVTSCMTNPKGDVHVRSMQAIWMCCLGWIHLLCSSATFLCWIWTLSFYRKIWIELNLHEPSQVCNY